jgi:hypothetical protein
MTEGWVIALVALVVWVEPALEEDVEKQPADAGHELDHW